MSKTDFQLMFLCFLLAGAGIHHLSGEAPKCPNFGTLQDLEIGQKIDVKDNGNSVTLIAYFSRLQPLSAGSIFTVESKSDTHIVLVDAVGKVTLIPITSIKMVEVWKDIMPNRTNQER